MSFATGRMHDCPARFHANRLKERLHPANGTGTTRSSTRRQVGGMISAAESCECDAEMPFDLGVDASRSSAGARSSAFNPLSNGVIKDLFPVGLTGG